MDCVQCILREIINQADRHALEGRMQLEKWLQRMVARWIHQFRETNRSSTPPPIRLNWRMIGEASTKQESRVVIVDSADVLGTNYDEVMANLNKLADAGVILYILPPDEQGE